MSNVVAIEIVPKEWLFNRKFDVDYKLAINGKHYLCNFIDVTSLYGITTIYKQ